MILERPEALSPCPMFGLTLNTVRVKYFQLSFTYRADINAVLAKYVGYCFRFDRVSDLGRVSI
jgi:hypothetical protein